MEASKNELHSLKATTQLLVASDELCSKSPLSFGRSLTDVLNQIQGWNVSYCSVRPNPESSFNETNTAFSQQAFRELQHFLRAVAERVGNLSASDQRCLVVVTGTLGGAYRLVKALWKTGLRERVLIVLHVRVHRVPLHPDCRNLFDCVDAIITESAFGTKSVMSVYKDRSRLIECPLIQIPPGFHSDNVANATHQHRQRVRKEVFGIEDDTLLIGCWLDRPDHRLGLAMHIFRILANDEYWKCLQCGKFNVSQLNPERLNLIPCDRCQKCHCEKQEMAKLSPKIRLHFIGPMAIRDEWSIVIDYRKQMNLQQQQNRTGSSQDSRSATPFGSAAAAAAADNTRDDQIDALLERSRAMAPTPNPSSGIDVSMLAGGGGGRRSGRRGRVTTLTSPA